MCSLDMRSKVHQAKDQLSCDLAGEAAILNVRSGIHYGLDPVGARIWKLIEQPRTLEEIRDTLVREYDVEPYQCENDLQPLPPTSHLPLADADQLRCLPPLDLPRRGA